MVKGKYKVGVIIPVYNVELYLESCLNSVINQTLDGVQIICINDGSKDKSAEILEKYRNYENVEIMDIENSGASKARNVGLSKVNADYISFVDSDDTIPNDYLESLYCHAKESNADIIMTGFNFLRNSSIQPYTSYASGVYESFVDKCSQILNGAIWDKMFKASLIKEHNLSFVEGRMWEDNLFILQALYFSNAMKIVNKPRYNYRLNPNSFTTSPELRAKQVMDSRFIYDKTMEFAREQNMTSDEVQAVDLFLRNKAMPGYIN